VFRGEDLRDGVWINGRLCGGHKKRGLGLGLTKSV
jgi:hypothetical protein